MTDVGTKLEERFRNTSVLLRYTNELIGLLESEESVLSEARSLANTTSKVADKAVKAKQATSVTKKALTENAKLIEKNSTVQLGDLSHLLKLDTTSSTLIGQKILVLQQDVQKRENECEDLKREHKRVKNSKVQRRLQKAIVNVNFDLLSTEQNVRGYAKGDDLRVFDVDYSTEDPCDVADRLWDMAC